MYERYLITCKDEPDKALAWNWDNNKFFWTPIGEYCDRKLLTFTEKEFCKDFIKEKELKGCEPYLIYNFSKYICPKCGEEMSVVVELDGETYYCNCNNCYCDLDWEVQELNGEIMAIRRRDR